MNKVLTGAGILLLLVLGFYLISGLFEKPDEVVTPVTQTEPEQEELTLEEPTITPVTVAPKTETQPQVVEKTEEAQDNQQILKQGDQLIQAKLQEIATDYAHNLKFPPYATPLNENSYEYLNPNAFIPFRLKMPTGEPFSYEIILPSSVLFKGIPIEGTFRIYGDQSEPLPQVLDVKAEILNRQKVLASTQMTMTQNDEMEKHFSFTIESPIEESKDWPAELQIKAVFLLSGYGEQSYILPFRLEESVAKVDGLGQETVDGPNLLIPVNITVNNSGTYRVSANLYSQTTGSPLVHIQGQQKIEGTSGTVILKAHVSALKERQDTGPYVAKTFLVARHSESGGADQSGNAGNAEFVIPGHDFNEYKDEPYVDMGEQEKLKRFNQIIQNW
ncbi:MAG: hypothetical protein HQM11_00920 [SAR324 cluster bacterium]|nr:hypothetical protein [SAR324 cluster bacterium]